MKTYIKTTLTILISGMLFSSCEDQLNQANPNQATEDTFWKDETDFNLALTSCYTPLKNAQNSEYYETSYDSENSDHFFCCTFVLRFCVVLFF